VAVPVLTGTHFHALDEKGRVIIPPKLRPALTEQFWMMLDENDNVAIYNHQTGLDVLAYCESMMAEYPGDEDIAAAVERVTSTAEQVSVESNWRVPVSELLRFHAQLDKKVVTVGVLNHAVLWSREKWESQQVQRLQSGDVRRAQAQILRAAASGIRKKAHEQAMQAEAEPLSRQEQADHDASAASGRRGSGVGSSAVVDGSPARTAASAGDGKRSARVLTLSQLGR
jgi:MraZ protein